MNEKQKGYNHLFETDADQSEGDEAVVAVADSSTEAPNSSSAQDALTRASNKEAELAERKKNRAEKDHGAIWGNRWKKVKELKNRAWEHVKKVPEKAGEAVNWGDEAFTKARTSYDRADARVLEAGNNATDALGNKLDDVTGFLASLDHKIDNTFQQAKIKAIQKVAEKAQEMIVDMHNSLDTVQETPGEAVVSVGDKMVARQEEIQTKQDTAKKTGGIFSRFRKGILKSFMN